jgi:hypothetical protein
MFTMRVSLFLSVTLAVALAVFGQVGCSNSNNTQGPVPGGSGSEAGGDGGSSGAGGDDGAGDDGGIPCPPVYLSDADLTAPTVSFRNAVMPIFRFSCATSTACHGGDPRKTIAQRGLFLGCSAMELDSGTCLSTGDIPEQVYQGLVGDPDAGPDAGPNKPIEINGMPFVTAGDPGKSYLIHKIDGDQCNLMGCVPNNAAVARVDSPGTTPFAANWCGQSMPFNVALLNGGPVCGGDADCTNYTTYARDTIRAWIAQGAPNN